MKPVLLIDFGSTYTKVTAADVDEGRLLGTANAYTTVQSDINNGLSDALSKLEKVTGKLDFCERYAASSAAGLPTMLERPMTTAFLPAISVPVDSIIRMQPAGVQGR